MHAHPRLRSVANDLLLFRINILLGAGYIFPANPVPSRDTVMACQRLNRLLCEQTAQGDVQPCLASPVLGAGMPMPELFQLFLLSIAEGKKDRDSWARKALAVMTTQGKLPKARSTQEAKKTFNQLLYNARQFETIVIPYLKGIGIELAPAVSG